jgi:4-alpha-glucanotransferase
MGLWRLFWVPPSGTARDGVYVRYPAAELLDIVSLESRRAGTYVIGEDLGTVEHGVRGEMARRNILSYRLLWFERSGLARLPTLSLAAVTNHDLPTLAGLWSGEDIEAQRSMGFEVDEGERAALIRSIARRARVRQDAPLEKVVEAVYRLLAGAPSALIAAPLEDALGVRERPNHPGTTEQWPNWRLALPASLEQIESDPAPRRLARILSRDSLES